MSWDDKKIHSQLLYSSQISKVKFSLAGSEEVRQGSFALINSYDLFRNNLPYPSGVYDAHMGTTDHSYRCQTCYNNKRNCLGHEGNISLNYPVWNPMGLSEGKKWIKLICFKCGKPVIEKSQYMKFHRHKRLDEASKLARTSSRKCIHCKELHPVIKKDNSEPLKFIAEYIEDKRQIKVETLYPAEIGKILSRITEETVIEMGKSVLSHPQHCILTDIRVPSVTIRPDVKKIGGGRSTNDDLTTMSQIIIKKNDSLPTVIPDTIEPKLEKLIYELNNAYFDFVKAGGDGAMNSIAGRLKGKGGRFRKNQLGKRVRNMCRSTIVGDPRIKIDEVGVPLTFARTIQYKETVQEYNKKRLLLYVQNGRKKYPGATKIIKRGTKTEYDVDSREIELENGDEILRDMIDGDPVDFNRQPSLMISNIAAHKAKVILDPKIKTLLMNVLCTPLN